jgi:hypothetical protein
MFLNTLLIIYILNLIHLLDGFKINTRNINKIICSKIDLILNTLKRIEKANHCVLYHSHFNKPILNLEKIKEYVNCGGFSNANFIKYISNVDWYTYNFDEIDQTITEKIMDNNSNVKCFTLISNSIRHIINTIEVADKLKIIINGIVIENSDTKIDYEFLDIIYRSVFAPIIIFPKLPKNNNLSFCTNIELPKINGRYLDECILYFPHKITRFRFYDISNLHCPNKISIISNELTKSSEFLEIQNLDPDFVRHYAIATFIEGTLFDPNLIVCRAGIIDANFEDLETILTV